MSAQQNTLEHFAETSTGVQAQQALQEMMVRSATDREFRRLLLESPRAAFAEYGCEIPESVSICFIENRHDATIVLPDPVDAMVELSEGELIAINGGATPAISAASSNFCVGAVVSASAAIIGISLGKLLN